jgi:putative flippase GtrA
LSTGRRADQATLSAGRLYQRFRQIIHEGAKFGIVGGIGVIVVLAGSDALHYELRLGKFTSVTVATVLATVVTFLGNRYWSFRHRQGAGARNETILFFILNGVGLLIQYACIFLVTDLIGLSGRVWYTIANFLGIGIGTLFRFWSYRKWVWVRPEVALARLRRGRHRKGRTTPVPPALPTQVPGQVLTQHRAAPPPHPAGPQPRGSHPAGPYQGGPYPAGPHPAGPQPVPLAKRPVRQAGPHGPGHPAHAGVQPMFAATHTPAPTTEDPDRWMS